MSYLMPLPGVGFWAACVFPWLFNGLLSGCGRCGDQESNVFLQWWASLTSPCLDGGSSDWTDNVSVSSSYGWTCREIGLGLPSLTMGRCVFATRPAMSSFVQSKWFYCSVLMISTPFSFSSIIKKGHWRICEKKQQRTFSKRELDYSARWVLFFSRAEWRHRPSLTNRERAFEREVYVPLALVMHGHHQSLRRILSKFTF